MDEPEDDKPLYLAASPKKSLGNDSSRVPLQSSATFRAPSSDSKPSGVTSGYKPIVRPTVNKMCTTPAQPPTCDIAHDIPMVRYLFTDFRALNILRNETTCTVVNEEAEITGYEIYIVEQWACDRRISTVITSYTGDSEHKIRLGVLSIPEDSTRWTAKTRAYFAEMQTYGAKPKQTELGSLFVTSLPTFPSHLNIVLVPRGDIRATAGLFDVNLNLKRMGCGGRSTISFTVPPDAVCVKFRQMFLMSDQVPITFAVRELIMLVQLSLYYFGLLPANYIDGLFCNHTRMAVQEWWKKVGQKRYSLRPTEEPICRQTVAAIIGLVMGASRRLSVVSNSRTPKDPYDAEYFMYSLETFQKNEHIPQTVCLDELTTERLMAVTGKGFNNDMFEILKGTMKEVSGKKHHRLADAETCDMTRLVKYLHGDRAKYLWLGVGRMRTIASTYDQDYLGIPIASLSHSESNGTRPQRGRRSMFRSVADQKSKTDGAIRSGVQKIKTNLQKGSKYSSSVNSVGMFSDHDYLNNNSFSDSTTSIADTLGEYPRCRPVFLKPNSTEDKIKLVRSPADSRRSRGARNIFYNRRSSKSAGEESGREDGGKLSTTTSLEPNMLSFNGQLRTKTKGDDETAVSDGYDEDYYYNDNDYNEDDYDDYYNYSDTDDDYIDNQEYYNNNHLDYDYYSEGRTDDSDSNDYCEYNDPRRRSSAYDGDVDNDYMDDDEGMEYYNNNNNNNSMLIDVMSTPNRRRGFGDINLSQCLRRHNSSSQLSRVTTENEEIISRRGPEVIKHRCSFSLVEDRILKWDFPFDEPVEKIVAKVESSKRLYTGFMTQVANIRQTCLGLEAQTEASIEAKQINQEVFYKLNQQIQDVYNSRARDKNELKTIDILGSKLNYQTRMLQQRVNEVEDVVDSFVSKVALLEDRMLKIAKIRGCIQTQMTGEVGPDAAECVFLTKPKLDSTSNGGDSWGFWARLRSYFGIFSEDTACG